MDPMSAGPEEHGRDEDRRPGFPERRPQRREAITPALASPAGGGAGGAPVRTTELVSGDLLITVNPVDGSEIEPCTPGRRPGRPERRGPRERAALQRAGRPSVPPGPAAPALPLLEREAEHDQLVELLGQGRSARLLGVPGSGRTALLDAVAARCGTLAPDGLIRLNGYRRTATELLHDLYTVVFHSEGEHRPDRAELRARVAEVGAVVVVDDLELGGEALDDLLSATPECAFLFAVSPEVSAPSPGAAVVDVLLAGLGRAASLELLERAAGRPLSEVERNWAGDLWFESEGLPLRFVQAGALLRQRDQLRRDPQVFDEFEAFAKPSGPTATGTTAETAFDPAFDGAPGTEGTYDIPLPTLGEGAAPAALLASRLSESARATLRFAVALGGEVPHQAHLPALVGDTHADAALGELMSCALLSPVGARYRLAPGVLTQLRAAGYADDAVRDARSAAEHYTWWTGHPSVTPQRITAEADAVLASMGPLLPEAADTALRLARSAAPALLAGLRWSAWEKALRAGQSAARAAGEVAEEAYFHHELGVLALCAGNLDRARAELEASIGMRGVVADRSGTVAGRRALALVSDLERGVTPVAAIAPPPQPAGAPVTQPTPIVAALPSRSAEPPLRQQPVRITQVPARAATGRRLLGGARRNVVAAGAGAVLAAVMGTVVGLGLTSGNGSQGTDHTATERSDGDGDALPPQEPAGGSSSAGTHAPAGRGSAAGAPAPSASGSSGVSGAPSSPGAGSPSGGTPQGPSDSGQAGHGPGSPSHSGGQAPSSPGGTGSGGSPGGPTSPPPSSPDDPTSPPSSPGSPTSPPPSSPDDPTSPPSSPDSPTSPTPSGDGSGSAQSASVTVSQPTS
ncbi:ATP-binding protein [Streptomyces sp. NBC_01497]|uniref:ATP-binding protein n=1 Tax=Streptomyces sp. NBC_01497 TaxID=2903885 RepID=UPI002E30F818|nr:ATP-binding protein [Streptomyces sp. NBC_01497]